MLLDVTLDVNTFVVYAIATLLLEIKTADTKPIERVMANARSHFAWPFSGPEPRAMQTPTDLSTSLSPRAISASLCLE